MFPVSKKLIPSLILCLCVLLTTLKAVQSVEDQLWTDIPDTRPPGENHIYLAPNDGWTFTTYETTTKGYVEFYHWDGVSWTGVQQIPDTRIYFTEVGLAAVSPTDIWAAKLVGYSREATAFWHYDGTKWSLFGDIPNVSIYSMDFLASDDAWASGWNGTDTLIYHWDGKAWSLSATVAGVDISASIDMLSDDYGWIAGNDGVIKRDSTGWNVFPIENTNILNSVKMISATDGWIVGAGAQVFRWNGGTWNKVAFPDGYEIESLTVMHSKSIWVIAKETGPDPVDRLFNYYGGRWVEQSLPVPDITGFDHMVMLSRYEGYLPYYFYDPSTYFYTDGMLHYLIELDHKVYMPVMAK